jgi:hypothetical protein
MSFLENLPTLVFGISTTKITSSGSYHLANSLPIDERTSPFERTVSGFTTTKAKERF